MAFATQSQSQSQQTTSESIDKLSSRRPKSGTDYKVSHRKVCTDFSIDAIIGTNTTTTTTRPKQEPNDDDGSLAINRTVTSTRTQPSGPSNPMSTKLTTTTNTDEPATEQSKHAKKCRPKNFQCPACKMAFSNNGQLKNHIRIHTGERPFVCDIDNCNKTFTRNEELTRHKLIHTGIRPHACTHCGKRFGRKDHLKKHVRTHERKKLRKRVFVPAAAAAVATSATSPSIVLPAPVQSISRAHPLPTSPTNVQQLLANDYWHKWYNILGYYQQQLQQHSLANQVSAYLFR